LEHLPGFQNLHKERLCDVLMYSAIFSKISPKNLGKLAVVHDMLLIVDRF
jgi:hypothetical protein